MANPEAIVKRDREIPPWEKFAPGLVTEAMRVKRIVKIGLGRRMKRYRRAPTYPRIVADVTSLTRNRARPGNPLLDTTSIDIVATGLNAEIRVWKFDTKRIPPESLRRKRAGYQLGNARAADNRRQRARSRDLRIHRLRSAGMSLREIRRETGAPKSTVWDVLNRPMHATGQHETALRANPVWQAHRVSGSHVEKGLHAEERGGRDARTPPLGRYPDAAAGTDSPCTGTDTPETRKMPDIREYRGLNPCCIKQFRAHPATKICCSCGTERSSPEERLAGALVARVLMREGADAAIAFGERLAGCRLLRRSKSAGFGAA